MTSLLIGASGFAYDDWRGTFYPPDLPRAQFFEFYCTRFRTVEINATFYRIYKPPMIGSLVRRAAGRMVFAAKMAQDVTHLSDLSPATVAAYRASIAPAEDAGCLAAVLLQFPQRFHFEPETRAYLTRVQRSFPELPLVLEIRHRSWHAPEALKFVEESGLSLSLIDAPDLPGLPHLPPRRVGGILYLRFHGRNAGDWYRGEQGGARYNYRYHEEELASWIEPLKEALPGAQTALAFFNNHVRGQATDNAETFSRLMGEPMKAPPYRDLLSGLE